MVVVDPGCCYFVVMVVVLLCFAVSNWQGVVDLILFQKMRVAEFILDSNHSASSDALLWPGFLCKW